MINTCRRRPLDTTIEFYQKLLNKVPGVVFAWKVHTDNRSELLFINDRGVDLFGLSMEQILADPMLLATCWHPEDYPSFQEAGQQARAEHRSFSWCGRLKKGDGSYRWVRCIAEPESIEDGATLWHGTLFDISNEKDIEQELRTAYLQQCETEQLFRAIIDTMPVGVTVMNTKGEFIISNKLILALSGNESGVATEVPANFRTCHADRKTPFAPEEWPTARALYGETCTVEMYTYMEDMPGSGKLLAIEASPMKHPDGTMLALAITRDITQQREMEEELLARNRQLAMSEEEKNQLVTRLRYAIEELSNPILEVWDDILAMPIIGVVDSRRTADMAQRLLAEVSRTQAQWVIIDLTGVEVVDTKTADNLIKLVRKVELIGARCVLTGIRPSVAETVVEIGVDFAGLTTLRNLKHGLQEALQRRRSTGKMEEDEDDNPKPRRRQRNMD